MAVAARWGTWEELVLGGAVLRHGTAAWVAVAAELRRRTPFPALFTPQECEAKYEDLQERYSGCDAWFEELRKQRVAELRRELERSEDSIGSLQSKLEGLNAERASSSSSDYNTSWTESPLPTVNVVDLDSSSKEASRDGSSAGSYMGETGRDWSQEYQISDSVSSQENDTKADVPDNSRKVSGGSQVPGIIQGIFRKKRGQRKRKSFTIIKEVSVRESSMAIVVKEELPVGCDQDVKLPQEDVNVPCEDVRTPTEDYGGHEGCKDSNLYLEGIMDSIMEHKGVSIFWCRLDSQKRARYKKMIRRHVDLQEISSRIRDGSVSSAKELFRELLLLANNAIVFYPKNSPEHKSAIMLRDLVTKILQEQSCTPPPTSSNNFSVIPVPVRGKTTKPQGRQVCDRKAPRSAVAGRKVVGAPVEHGKKRGSCDEAAPAESLTRKRVIGGRAAKGGCVSGKRGRESPDKGRKRARRR